MNVRAFVKRAKDAGVGLLVFQETPARRVFYTGKDADVPKAFGSALAWAAMRLGSLSGEHPLVVFRSMMTLVVTQAEAVIREEGFKGDPEEAEMRKWLNESAEEDSDEDDCDDYDSDSSHLKK